MLFGLTIPEVLVALSGGLAIALVAWAWMRQKRQRQEAIARAAAEQVQLDLTMLWVDQFETVMADRTLTTTQFRDGVQQVIDGLESLEAAESFPLRAMVLVDIRAFFAQELARRQKGGAGAVQSVPLPSFPKRHIMPGLLPSSLSVVPVVPFRPGLLLLKMSTTMVLAVAVILSLDFLPSPTFAKIVGIACVIAVPLTHRYLARHWARHAQVQGGLPFRNPRLRIVLQSMLIGVGYFLIACFAGGKSVTLLFGQTVTHQAVIIGESKVKGRTRGCRQKYIVVTMDETPRRQFRVCTYDFRRTSFYRGTIRLRSSRLGYYVRSGFLP